MVRECDVSAFFHIAAAGGYFGYLWYEHSSRGRPYANSETLLTVTIAPIEFCYGKCHHKRNDENTAMRLERQKYTR